MKTQREKAADLIRAIDSVEAIPRSLIRQLRELIVAAEHNARLRGWPIGDRTRIGSGSHVALERLCDAAEKFVRALEDAKSLLEVR